MRYAGIFLCGIVLGISAFLIFYHLSIAPLQLFDEGTYAQVINESFQRHDFLTFTYQGQLFFDKPPLYFWLAAPVMAAAGEWAIRVPAAIAGVLLVAATMLLAYKITNKEWVAALAGAYLVWIGLYIDAARQARLDVLVALCIVLAFYCALRKNYWGWGASVGFAILTKSVIGLFAIVPALLFWEDFNAKKFWQSSLFAFAIAAPWHLFEWARWGNEFWVSYIGHNVLERYSSNLFYASTLDADYWARLLDYARLPFGVFLLALVVFAFVWRAIPLRLQRVIGATLITMALMAAVFWTSQTRALTYLVPLYPLASVIVALSSYFLTQYATLKHDKKESIGGTHEYRTVIFTNSIRH